MVSLSRDQHAPVQYCFYRGVIDYVDGNEGVTDPIAAARKIATGKRLNVAQKGAVYTAADAVIVGRSGERYQVVAGLRRAISVPAEEPDGYR